jgi:hypothetical protein
LPTPHPRNVPGSSCRKKKDCLTNTATRTGVQACTATGREEPIRKIKNPKKTPQQEARLLFRLGLFSFCQNNQTWFRSTASFFSVLLRLLRFLLFLILQLLHSYLDFCRPSCSLKYCVVCMRHPIARNLYFSTSPKFPPSTSTSTTEQPRRRLLPPVCLPNSRLPGTHPPCFKTPAFFDILFIQPPVVFLLLLVCSLQKYPVTLSFLRHLLQTLDCW